MLRAGIIAVATLAAGCATSSLDASLRSAGLREMSGAEYALIAGDTPPESAPKAIDPSTGNPSRNYYPAFWCAGMPEKRFGVVLEANAIALVAEVPDSQKPTVPSELVALVDAFRKDNPSVSFVERRWISDFVEFDRGYIVSFYAGEFGGAVAWFGRDGSFEDHHFRAVSDLLFTGDELFFAYGVDHLGLRAGGIGVLKYTPDAEGSPFGVAGRQLSFLPMDSAVHQLLETERGLIAFRAWSIATLSSGGEVRYTSTPPRRPFQHVNSSVIAADGTLAAGFTFGVAVWEQPFEQLDPQIYIPKECSVAVRVPY